MLRPTLLAACLLLVAVPAAAEAPPAEAANQSYVDVSPVGLPIVVEGRLVNYVFVSLRLWARPGTDVTELRAREPRFRDALVRASHRSPFVVPTDYTRIDEVALTRVMAVEAARIAGSPVFQRVQITSQTPQRRSGVNPRR